MTLSRLRVTRLFFACVLFVQIGLIPIVSFAVLGLILLLTHTVVKGKDIASASLFFLLSMESTLQAYLSLSELSYDLNFSQVRLIVVFTLIYFIIGLRLEFELPIDKVKKYNFRLLLILVCGAIIQVLLKKIGIYTYIPDFLLAMKETGTTLNADQIEFLKNIDLLQYRVSMFYSEASYYGLIIASLLVIGFLVETSNDSKFKLFLIGIVGVAVAETFYGMLAIVVLYIVDFAPYIRRQFANISKVKKGLFFVVVVIFVMAIFASFFFQERLGRLILLDDESGTTRLISPFTILSSTWSNLSYFGYPVFEIYEKLNSNSLIQYYEDPPLHNGLINLFINNGIVAFLLLVLIFKRVKSKFLMIFICLVFMQNGAYGNWDKAYLIGYICVIANTIYFYNQRASLRKVV